MLKVPISRQADFKILLDWQWRGLSSHIIGHKYHQRMRRRQ